MFPTARPVPISAQRQARQYFVQARDENGNTLGTALTDCTPVGPETSLKIQLPLDNKDCTPLVYSCSLFNSLSCSTSTPPSRDGLGLQPPRTGLPMGGRTGENGTGDPTDTPEPGDGSQSQTDDDTPEFGNWRVRQSGDSPTLTRKGWAAHPRATPKSVQVPLRVKVKHPLAATRPTACQHLAVSSMTTCRHPS